MGTALAVLLGGVAGLVTGMAGMGAGAVLTPALLLAGAGVNDAVGITLLSSLVIRVMTSASFSPRRLPVAAGIGELAAVVHELATERRLATLLTIGGVSGAAAGLATTTRLDTGVTKTVIGMALLLTAASETVRARQERREHHRCPDDLSPRPTVHHPVLMMAVSAAGGWLTAVTGTGVGTVTGTGLMAVCRRLPTGLLVRANILQAMFTLTLPAIVYQLIHDVDLNADWGLPVVLGGAAGAVLGARVQQRVSTDTLRGVVVVVMILLGTRMVIPS